MSLSHSFHLITIYKNSVLLFLSINFFLELLDLTELFTQLPTKLFIRFHFPLIPTSLFYFISSTHSSSLSLSQSYFFVTFPYMLSSSNTFPFSYCYVLLSNQFCCYCSHDIFSEILSHLSSLKLSTWLLTYTSFILLSNLFLIHPFTSPFHYHYSFYISIVSFLSELKLHNDLAHQTFLLLPWHPKHPSHFHLHCWVS